MRQDRLFRLAHAGISIGAHYVTGEGWQLAARFRRADEAWNDTELISHSHLTTVELVDVIEAELFVALLRSADLDGEQ